MQSRMTQEGYGIIHVLKYARGNDAIEGRRRSEIEKVTADRFNPPVQRLGCRQPDSLFGIIHRDHTCRPRIPKFASTTSSPASNIQQM